MSANILIIAAAGSGKTTFLVEEALKVTTGNVLITTYTISNEREIKNKFLQINGCIPHNVTIRTWFSFLLEHGVKPYQTCMLDTQINGLLFCKTASGIKYNNGSFSVQYSEHDDPIRHYLSNHFDMYSDKISKFVCNCNEKSNNSVLNRISQIFSHIYIDEVQDLAGYDLELIKLFLASNISIILVGDPRQVTYLTHHPKKHTKYLNGAIKDFILENVPKKIKCHIDETSLSSSHRNNKEICDFSSSLYPSLTPSRPCQCYSCCSSRNVAHRGLFLVKEKDIDMYIQNIKPVQLRWDRNVKVSQHCPVYNFGESKGSGFPHVLIYLTKPMKEWFENNANQLKNEAKAKLYVAITRAHHSVGFVYNYTDNSNFADFQKFYP